MTKGQIHGIQSKRTGNKIKAQKETWPGTGLSKGMNIVSHIKIEIGLG